jgi:hypothetical protein
MTFSLQTEISFKETRATKDYHKKEVKVEALGEVHLSPNSLFLFKFKRLRCFIKKCVIVHEEEVKIALTTSKIKRLSQLNPVEAEVVVRLLKENVVINGHMISSTKLRTTQKLSYLTRVPTKEITKTLESSFFTKIERLTSQLQEDLAVVKEAHSKILITVTEIRSLLNLLSMTRVSSSSLRKSVLPTATSSTIHFLKIQMLTWFPLNSLKTFKLLLKMWQNRRRSSTSPIMSINLR